MPSEINCDFIYGTEWSQAANSLEQRNLSNLDGECTYLPSLLWIKLMAVIITQASSFKESQTEIQYQYEQNKANQNFFVHNVLSEQNDIL